MNNHYPKDIFVSLEALKPYYHGRISILEKEESFSTEIAIIHIESGKIFQYIGSFYHFPSEKEAIDSSLQKMANYFKEKN